MEALRASSEPIVLLVYGDHKPGVGDVPASLRELGVDLDLRSWEGVKNYYSTTWLIWANDAACELLGRRFVGEEIGARRLRGIDRQLIIRGSRDLIEIGDHRSVAGSGK